MSKFDASRLAATRWIVASSRRVTPSPQGMRVCRARGLPSGLRLGFPTWSGTAAVAAPATAFLSASPRSVRHAYTLLTSRTTTRAQFRVEMTLRSEPGDSGAAPGIPVDSHLYGVAFHLYAETRTGGGDRVRRATRARRWCTGRSARRRATRRGGGLTNLAHSHGQAPSSSMARSSSPPSSAGGRSVTGGRPPHARS